MAHVREECGPRVRSLIGFDAPLELRVDPRLEDPATAGEAIGARSLGHREHKTGDRGEEEKP